MGAISATIDLGRIFAFAVLNTVVVTLGIPELWSTVISAALLAATMAFVWRSRSVLFPLLLFVAVLAAHATLRFGGLPAFLAFEGVLLIVAIAM